LGHRSAGSEIACAAPGPAPCRTKEGPPGISSECNHCSLGESASQCQNGVGQERMIDTLLNLLFRCSHKRLTRPVTPVGKAGSPQGATYVVYLDCGKQFSYDVKEMRIGKPLANSAENGVLPPNPPKNNKGWKLALWASVPLALLAGSVM